MGDELLGGAPEARGRLESAPMEESRTAGSSAGPKAVRFGPTESMSAKEVHFGPTESMKSEAESIASRDDEEDPRYSSSARQSTCSTHSAKSQYSAFSFYAHTFADEDEDEFYEDGTKKKRKRKNKKSKGDIVPMPDANVPLTMQAFEISDEFRISHANTSKTPTISPYAFARNNRRSIMLSLGLDTLSREASTDPTEIDDDFSTTLSMREGRTAAQELMDPYTKVADEACMSNYMAVVIGFGALSLPSAMKDTGLVPGLICIVFMGALNSFWAHRLIELPQLLRQNLELYGDVANAIFPCRIIQWIAWMSIVGTWYGGMVLYYYNILYYSPHEHWENPPDGSSPTTSGRVLCFVMEVCLAAILIPWSFRTSAKELQRNVGWSLKAMVVILVLIVLCGSYRSIVPAERPASNGQYSSMFRPHSDSKFAQGIQTICVAYCGLGMTPYVVSEMLHPENARVMMDKAISKITFYFLLAAFFGYIGWGDEVQTCVRDSLKDDETMPEVLRRGVSTLISICFMGKCLCCYTLLFLPLIREVEAFLMLEDSPPVLLGLPWAIRNSQRVKDFVKVFVVISSMFIRWACSDYLLVEEALSVPFFTSNLILPATLSLSAMWIYRCNRSTETMMGHGADEIMELPIFGARWWHVAITALLAIVSIMIACLVMNQAVNAAVKSAEADLNGLRHDPGRVTLTVV